MDFIKICLKFALQRPYKEDEKTNRWEKIFAKHISDKKKLVSRAYKELLKLKKKKKRQSSKKMGKRHSTENDILMAKKHMKIFLTSIH